MFTDLLFASGGWLVFGLLIAPILLLFGAVEGAGVLVQAALTVVPVTFAWAWTGILGQAGRRLGRSLRPVGAVLSTLAPLALKGGVVAVLLWSFDPLAFAQTTAARATNPLTGQPWPAWGSATWHWIAGAPWRGLVLAWWRLVGQAPALAPPPHAAWTADLSVRLAHVTASAVGLAVGILTVSLALAGVMGLEIRLWQACGWRDPAARPAPPAGPSVIETIRATPRLTPPDWAALLGEREARRYD